MRKHNILLLLIERDKSLRACLHKALSKYISQVIVVKSSEEAYQSYLKKRPDIVLIDFTAFDFIQQIRKHEKKTRILVMSSKPDTQLFVKSIECGAKGFLQKPINEIQLAQLLGEITKDIRLEKNFEKEEQNRLMAEAERERSEKILETLSKATALFFRYGVSPKNINKILKLIGRVTGSSRVNIFNIFDEAGERFVRLVYTWASEDAFDISDNAPLRKIPFVHSSIGKWEKVMEKGGSIVGQVRDFDGPEQKMLIENSVKSILSIPVFVNKNWWGFISLDDCKEERNWSKDEIRAMEAVGFNFGAAIYRLNVEREMLAINESLENRVSERTIALEDEISERMLAEALLKDSEEKYRLVFENASSGIILIQAGEVLLVSPSMVEIMERSPKSLLGKLFGTYIVSDKPLDIKKILLSFQEGKRKDALIQINTPKNKNKWLELKVTKINWDNQGALLIFATDVSLQVKAENELKQLNKDLIRRITQEVKQVKEQQQLLNQKSKLESLGELSAGLAHEINQPLLGISMGLDNILMATQGDGFSPLYVSNKIDVLFKDIDRIKQVIEHVRIFSRGQDNTSKERIEISRTISNILILANKALSADYIDFSVKMPESELFVTGNPYRLEQVILNLLTNARHAVDESKIDKAAKPVRKSISLEVKQKDNFVFIAVSDNGIGIPKKHISKIFDPFFTTKNEERGTGLGLSISYGIISEMNGTIEVDSVEEQYTILTVKLPISN